MQNILLFAVLGLGEGALIAALAMSVEIGRASCRERVCLAV